MQQAEMPYLEFKLVFRKTNKDPTKGKSDAVCAPTCHLTHVGKPGQEYQIPPDPDHPEIDCYTHMVAWLTILQSLLQRKLHADDFLFPAIASTNTLKFGEPTTRSGFESLMGEVIEQSGLMEGRNGKFTTYCFRRGGAQYRFMWTSQRWSLKAVKWWGGWSSSENVCHDFHAPTLLKQDLTGWHYHALPTRRTYHIRRRVQRHHDEQPGL